MSASNALRRDQELILKAAAVAQCAPREWTSFVEALKVYADGEARACVSSPSDQLQRMQGRAQQCAEIVTLFEGAVKSASRITQSQAGKSAAVNR